MGWGVGQLYWRSVLSLVPDLGGAFPRFPQVEGKEGGPSWPLGSGLVATTPYKEIRLKT